MGIKETDKGTDMGGKDKVGERPKESKGKIIRQKGA